VNVTAGMAATVNSTRAAAPFSGIVNGNLRWLFDIDRTARATRGTSSRCRASASRAWSGSAPEPFADYVQDFWEAIVWALTA
jgi:hypothetical protein